MFKIRSVKFNFLMNLILTASSLLFPIITFPYVSRILQPDGMGKIAFASSVVSYFSMIAMLGIPTYGIVACSKVRDNKYKLSKTVQELLIINIIAASISILALFIALNTIDKLEEQRVLILINAIGLILNVVGVNWLYMGLEQYSYITIRSLIFRFISIALMFAFVKEKSDYIVYGAILVFASVGSNIMNFINLGKYIYLKPLGNYELKTHIRPILTFFATTVAHSVYVNLDVVMLGFMTDDTSVGLYNAATRIKSLLLSLVLSLGVVMLPRLSYYVQNKLLTEFNQIIIKVFNFVIIFSLPIVVYFIMFASETLLLLAGKDFSAGSILLQILMPIVLIAGVANVTGTQVLIPMGLEKIVLISVIIGAVIDLVLNIILIPIWGASGAAIGTLAAEFAVLITQLFYLKNILYNIEIKVNFRQVIFSILLSIIIVSTLKFMIVLPLIIELVLSASIFFGVYFLTLILQKEQFTTEIFQSLFKKLKIIIQRKN